MSNSLRARWKRIHSSDRHLQLWNAEAANYASRPIPTPNTDGFVANVIGSGHLKPSDRLLDLGCGAGLYSFAFAPYVAEVIGYDLAPAMIKAAQDRSGVLGIKNTTFATLDWSQTDINALGLFEAFDIGVAHMTPAIAEYEAFEKFINCVRRHFFFETFIRRQHPMMRLAFESVGLSTAQLWNDDQLYCTLEYLLSHGFKPQLKYRPATWGTRSTLEAMIEFCTWRVALHKRLSPEEKVIIDSVIRAQSTDGWIDCPQTATIVTVDWAK